MVLPRPGVFASSEKAHGSKKPPCVLLKMLGFSAAIIIRFGMWMQAFSPVFGPPRPLLHTYLHCETLSVVASAFDLLDRLRLKVESEFGQVARSLRNRRYYLNDTRQCLFASPATRPSAVAVNGFPEVLFTAPQQDAGRNAQEEKYLL